MPAALLFDTTDTLPALLFDTTDTLHDDRNTTGTVVVVVVRAKAVPDHEGKTALHHAAAKGSVEMIGMMISKVRRVRL